MKRRNADSGKMRRPLKRNKITEGIYGSTLLYLKVLMLWAMVLFADYMSEFRFEFLWPLWMMLRSVYDSFKYQGLAFSVFFVFIALTSDVVCFFFIPVQWIIFVASTYVWVQYVWYTDKGICLPTVALCAALVWAEAALRGSGARDPRTNPSPLFPSNVDLCRPFAAHCVGYPVVTLGFGVKTYVGHRIRLRRQRDVRSENEFYYQLLRQALPEAHPDQPAIKDSLEKPTEKTEVDHKPYLNGSAVNHTQSKSKKCETKAHVVDQTATETSNGVNRHTNHVTSNHIAINHSHSNGVAGHAQAVKDKPSNHSAEKGHSQSQSHSSSNGVIPNHAVNVEKVKPAEVAEEKIEKLEKETNESTKNETKIQSDSLLVIEAVPVEKTKGLMKSSNKWERKENAANVQREERRKAKNKDKDNQKEKDKDKESQKEKDHNDNHKHNDSPKESPIQKEREVLSIKEERRQEKEREKEREREAKEKKEREKIVSKELEEREKYWNGELKRFRVELAEAKAAEAEVRAELRRALATSSQQERQRSRDVQQLRRSNEDLHAKLNSISNWRSAERAERAALERRLAEERRARATAEQRLSAPPPPPPAQLSGPCTRADCRAEVESLRRDLVVARTPPPPPPPPPPPQASPECNNEELQRLAERATHLQRSLSAETRIKLDLFSALGEAKRQLEIKGSMLYARDKEIDELKSKIAQMLAVMPPDSFVSPLSLGGAAMRGAVGLESYGRDAAA